MNPCVLFAPCGAVDVSWVSRDDPTRGPIARLRIRVDVPADADLSPEHAIRLALGIVCERTDAGVRLGWGVPSRDKAPVFASFGECEAWLLERVAGMRSIAAELAGTATGLYHADRAAFLACCVSVLRSHASRLWGRS